MRAKPERASKWKLRWTHARSDGKESDTKLITESSRNRAVLRLCECMAKRMTLADKSRPALELLSTCLNLLLVDRALAMSAFNSEIAFVIFETPAPTTRREIRIVVSVNMRSKPD